MWSCDFDEVIALKKKIAALCLGAMLSFSAVAMAATPEAEMMSAEQAKAVTWIDSLLVKNKPEGAWKTMSSEFQKNVELKKFTELRKKIDQEMGGLKGSSFLSWARPNKQEDQMSYLLFFEKTGPAQCFFIFDKQGNLQDFVIRPLAQKQDKDAKPAKDAKDAKKDNKKK